MAVRWLLIAVVGLVVSDVSCQVGKAPFGDPPPLPTKGMLLCLDNANCKLGSSCVMKPPQKIFFNEKFS